MNAYRRDFPIFNQLDDKGRPIAYLDSAATSQKPRAVLEAALRHYETANANPHRGSYDWGERSTRAVEEARETVRRFIGAKKAEEIVFTHNATETLNLVAHGVAMRPPEGRRDIVVSVSEHHSNLVPWQRVAQAWNSTITYLDTDGRGVISAAEIEAKITPNTAVVAVAHASNVTGVVHPVAQIVAKAHSVGATVVLDATQSAPHMPLDVAELDVDFCAFSGHKMLAPMGVGVLYGKLPLLEALPPLLLGGGMIEYVGDQQSTFAPVPQKFEGGTQNVGGIVGLAAAVDYLTAIGMENIEREERRLTAYLLDALRGVEHLTLVGPQEAEGRIGVVSFTVEGAHPHDVATILGADGVAVRAGHHCAQPLMRRLGVAATCRASVYLYNNEEDVDRLAASLKGVRRWLGHAT